MCERERERKGSCLGEVNALITIVAERWLVKYRQKGMTIIRGDGYNIYKLLITDRDSLRGDCEDVDVRN